MAVLRRAVAGVAAAGVLGVAVLAAEAFVATRRTYVRPESAPPVAGVYGDAGRPALRLVVLGDSTGAGLGVRRTDDTVGGRLAAALATDERRVLLSSVAVSGARTADLRAQVGAALADRPDIAVVLVGANDATHGTRLAAVRRELGEAVRRLREAGVAVVVGTCPDLGAVRAFLQPLRALAGGRGSQVAAAETGAVRRSGGDAVDIAAETGAAFRADSANLASDDFHPSAQGYALWADALLPAVQRAAAARPAVPPVG